MVLPAALFGWRAFHYIGHVAGFLVAAGLLSVAVPIMRTCLIVADEGLIDRRAVRTVRVPWRQITEFRVARPGGLWGGFCVIADCRDGMQSTSCQRGLLLRVISMNCSGCAGPLRNVLRQAARTSL